MIAAIASFVSFGRDAADAAAVAVVPVAVVAIVDVVSDAPAVDAATNDFVVFLLFWLLYNMVRHRTLMHVDADCYTLLLLLLLLLLLFGMVSSVMVAVSSWAVL